VVWTAARVQDWEQTGNRPPVAVWLPAHTARFLNSIQKDRLYAAYHLIALRGLRWRDVDLDGATAVICQQLQQYDGHLSLCPPKTASSQRVIALDRTTVTVLRRHHAAQQAERTAMGDGYRDSGYVFTGLNGDPMAPDRLTRHFRQLSDEAGLPPVRLHDLRHGAATLALAAGAELKTIQDQLGHSSIVLTADTYISVLPDVARKAAEDTATLIIQAGYLVPGTSRPRRPGPRPARHRTRATAKSTTSLAHPAQQIGHLASDSAPHPGPPRAKAPRGRVPGQEPPGIRPYPGQRPAIPPRPGATARRYKPRSG
jgi:Phage integrase family